MVVNGLRESDFFRQVQSHFYFNTIEARCVLLSILLQNVSYLLEKKQEIAACLDVLGDIIVGLQHLTKVVDRSQMLLLILSKLINFLYLQKSSENLRFSDDF